MRPRISRLSDGIYLQMLLMLPALTQVSKFRQSSLAALGQPDWKALMHALRLSQEGIEYHECANVSLPRPNADYLRAIRNGQVALAEVEQATRQAISDCSEAEQKSVLPQQADYAWIENLVYSSYRQCVALDFDRKDNSDTMSISRPAY